MTTQKTILYARVSSKEQEQEGYSIPAQLKFLMEYASKEDLQIVKEFVDVETAKKAGRTNFNAMLEYLKENKDVKHLLVEKTDRLLRNITDYATIENLMTNNEVTLHLVKENVVLDKDSRSNEKFIFGIKALMAKNYVDNLSEESKKGLYEKASQGIYPSLAPVGYLNYTDKNGKKNIKLDEPTAPFIRRMFEFYATGNYSLSTLRKQILKEGFIYRSGKNFHKSTLEKILKNEFYTGIFHWKGEKYTNATHTPIIDKLLFEKVQSILRNPNKSKSRKDLFTYTNLIKCEKCGCSLTAEIQKEKYIYYRCSAAKGNCKMPYIRQERIDEKIEEMLDSIHLTQEQVDLIYKGLKESLKDKIEYHSNAITSINKQIKVLQNRINKAYIDKVDEVISEDFWKHQTNIWLKEKEELSIKLLAHQKSDTNYFKTADIILKLASKAKYLFGQQNVEEKKKLVKLLLSNSTYNGKNLLFSMRKPFDSIVECKKLGNWGGKGVYARAKRNILQALDKGVPLSLNYCINALNIECISEFLAEWHKFKLKGIAFTVWAPFQKNYEFLNLSPDDRKKVSAILIRL
ncbi:MAG: recombinase family protein [Bacteroidetes bacterium]|nr:recombinase family protein [Bacteroidota bacterium]